MTGIAGASNPQVRRADSGIVAGSEIRLENTLKVETRVRTPLGLDSSSPSHSKRTKPLPALAARIVARVSAAIRSPPGTECA